MSYFDWLDLDARLLRLLVAVVDTGSITGAAQRLGVTQSAVSHLLDKLRGITGDALFTNSGRGIVATARALTLAERARELLADLERFAQSETFDPAHWQTTFTIAANDYHRDALLPALMQRLRQQAPGVSLRVIASDVPTPEMLRQQQCQLIISPRPPEGKDIVRRFRVMVPGFAGLPAFIRGTDLLTTVPGLMREHLMRGLQDAEVPVPCPTMPMYMIWHLRHPQDMAHRWLRRQIEDIALPLQPRQSAARGAPDQPA